MYVQAAWTTVVCRAHEAALVIIIMQKENARTRGYDHWGRPILAGRASTTVAGGGGSRRSR